MYYVYGLYKKNIKYKTNVLDEHLFYVGISSSDKNFYFRMKNHKTDKCNPYKLNIIAKYDFIIRVFWNTNTQKEAEEREEFLIHWFGRRIHKTGILTNILSGANDNIFIGKKHTKTTRKKISKSNKGKHNYWKGKKLSDEHKEKIGKSGKGKKRTQETKKNISNSLIGKKLSKEHKLKLSQNSYLKGKPAKNVTILELTANSLKLNYSDSIQGLPATITAILIPY